MGDVSDFKWSTELNSLCSRNPSPPLAHPWPTGSFTAVFAAWLWNHIIAWNSALMMLLQGVLSWWQHGFLFCLLLKPVHTSAQQSCCRFCSSYHTTAVHISEQCPVECSVKTIHKTQITVGQSRFAAIVWIGIYHSWVKFSQRDQYACKLHQPEPLCPSRTEARGRLYHHSGRWPWCGWLPGQWHGWPKSAVCFLCRK